METFLLRQMDMGRTVLLEPVVDGQNGDHVRVTVTRMEINGPRKSVVNVLRGKLRSMDDGLLAGMRRAEAALDK